MRNYINLIILGLVLVVGMGACDAVGLGGGGAPKGISLDVPKTQWDRSETIQLRLRNDTDRSLGYNLCIRTLDRRVAGGWVPVQSKPENTACTGELNVLQPGREALSGQTIYSFIPGGTYRFRTSVEWPLNDGEVSVTSNGFGIAEP